jgi:hypothetical protein
VIDFENRTPKTGSEKYWNWQCQILNTIGLANFWLKKRPPKEAAFYQLLSQFWQLSLTT